MSNARVVAVIPARGGSKGVPGKNLRRVAGRSLVERAVDACHATDTIDRVVVSTDSAQIAALARGAGAGVVHRPERLAGDTASSESALLHALSELSMEGVDPQVLVFVQCTSPFVDPADLDHGVALVASGAADSAFAGVATHGFLWRGDTDGVVGQNHDPRLRPRRQDRTPDVLETGAFYVMSVPGFRVARHRFFGVTAPVLVPELGVIDIDAEHDLERARALAPLIEPVRRERLDVDVVITDFDGVHTDDSALVDAHGVESVRVSRSDGLGVERLRQAGVPLLIVSKETNQVVRARAAKLGVEVLPGVQDKAPVVAAWLAAHGVAAARTAYVGNDINDLGPMALVGWPVAVADAHPEVRAAARLVLERRGGHGAVRELCDLVLAEHVLRGAGPAEPDAAPATPAPVPRAAAGTVRAPILLA